MERELFIVGVTAVEDKLQDQVPETIADFLKASQFEKGRERKGRERKGKEGKGRERKGKEANGREGKMVYWKLPL